MKYCTKPLLATVCALGLIACDSDDNDTPAADMTVPTVAEATVAGATAAASVSLLNYTMPDINGGQRRENAIVMVPMGETPEGGWPVIGWGHGTTGTADICAPSISGNLSGYDSYLNAFLAAGYAIVAADYEGLGTEGGHPYLHLDSEGRSINYAVEAATEAVEGLSNRYAAVGHSQGGHAALGAGALAAENAGLSLVGVVALAPASQLLQAGQFATSVTDNTELPIEERVAAAVSDLAFSSLLLHGVKEVFPAFDIDAAYGEDGAELQQQVEETCLPQIFDSLTSSVPQILARDNNVDSIIVANAAELEQAVSYFESVEPGNREMLAPVMIAQGDADTTVPLQASQALSAQLSAVSDDDIDPELMTYEGATHSGVLADSLEDVLTFLAVRFAAE